MERSYWGHAGTLSRAIVRRRGGEYQQDGEVDAGADRDQGGRTSVVFSC